MKIPMIGCLVRDNFGQGDHDAPSTAVLLGTLSATHVCVADRALFIAVHIPRYGFMSPPG